MYSSRLDLQMCTLEYTLEYLLHHCHENMMNACELLLMRARARRAYCKKCRVHNKPSKGSAGQIYLS
jgi:hypothetical protein